MILLRQKIFVNLKGLSPEVAERVKAKRKVLAENLLELRKELIADEARLMEEAKAAQKWRRKKGGTDRLTGINSWDLVVPSNGRSIFELERSGLGSSHWTYRKPNESRTGLFRRFLQERRDKISSGTKKRAEAAIKEAKNEAFEQEYKIPDWARKEPIIKPRKART